MRVRGAPARFQYRDFVCPRCGEQEEHLYEVDLGEEILCSSCASDGEVTAMQPLETGGVGYLKTIAKGNSDYNERERERLEKRAAEHWEKKGRSEAMEKEHSLFERYSKETK